MNNSTLHNECPICMEVIDLCKNCVNTECGHLFHSSCLMKSVSINGFGCPYCRTIMAEKTKDKNDDEWSDTSSYVDGLFDDYALRGFRFLFNNLNGDIHEQHDITEEDEDNEEENNEEEDNEEENVNLPSISLITEKLIEKGITMEHLVRTYLIDEEDFNADYEENYRIERRVNNTVLRILNNYTLSQSIQ